MKGQKHIRIIEPLAAIVCRPAPRLFVVVLAGTLAVIGADWASPHGR
jgi:hypothetical protein